MTVLQIVARRRRLILFLFAFKFFILPPFSAKALRIKFGEGKSNSERANKTQQKQRSFGGALEKSTTSHPTLPATVVNIPDYFPSCQAIFDKIDKLQSQYPSLISVETIGYSTYYDLPIQAIKISDNAGETEDESTILFSALHHAREPVGLIVCLELAEKLLEEYDEKENMQRYINELAIWIIPVVNPDGYKYMMDNDLGFPWWRKNLRDNDENGRFDPAIDGVDLNRNYDFNWRLGGESIPASWFYRGMEPFSEPEIDGIKRIALRENFVAGVSFHSYGEAILYPWGNFDPAPDHRLIINLAESLASFMKKSARGGAYNIYPLNGRVGQSSVWMYGALRSIDYIYELADQYFPDKQSSDEVIEGAIASSLYLMEQALTSGIRGHVLDASTREPLNAEIHVVGYESNAVAPRRTDRYFGRFERILLPGNYTIEFVSNGHEKKKIENVEVKSGKPAYFEVYLQKADATLPPTTY